MGTVTESSATRTTELGGEIRHELRLLCTYGARLHEIRGRAPSLMGLQLTATKLVALRRLTPDVFEPGSDGRPEAVAAVLKDCVAAMEDPSDTRLLWTVMDFDGKLPATHAKVRRAEAGRTFRGRDAQQVGESSIRQRYEPEACNRLMGLLLSREDELGGPT